MRLLEGKTTEMQQLVGNIHTIQHVKLRYISKSPYQQTDKIPQFNQKSILLAIPNCGLEKSANFGFDNPQT